MVADIASAGVGALIGGAEWAYGAYQKQKAIEAAKKNIRPTYQTPQSENDLGNLVMAQGGQGLSAGARQIYQNDANNGLSATLAAINRGDGDPNAAAGVYGNYEQGINHLALLDDAQRMKHMDNIAGWYQRNTANEDKKWQLNQFDPYKDKAQAIANQTQAAQNMEQGGMNMVGSSILGGIRAWNDRKKPYQDVSQRTVAPVMTDGPQMGSGTFQRPASNSVQSFFQPYYKIPQSQNVDAGQPNVPVGTYNVNQNIFGGAFGGNSGYSGTYGQ